MRGLLPCAAPCGGAHDAAAWRGAYPPSPRPAGPCEAVGGAGRGDAAWPNEGCAARSEAKGMGFLLPPLGEGELGAAQVRYA